MNVFRRAADILHVLAVLLLLVKIGKKRSCSGISGVAQILYLVIFITRYVDLAYVFISYYNTALKHFFIGGTALTVVLMCTVARDTYDYKHDSKWMFLLMLPAAILSLLVNEMFTAEEVLYAFSRYLETVAMLPQFLMICRMGRAEVTVVYYLAMLAVHRFLYMCNWVYRYEMEGFVSNVITVPGCLQFILYAAFFFLYFKEKCQPSEAELDAVEKGPLLSSAIDSAVPSALPDGDHFIQLRGLTKYYEKFASFFIQIRLVIERECFAFFGKGRPVTGPSQSETLATELSSKAQDVMRTAEKGDHLVESCVSPAVDSPSHQSAAERLEKTDAGTRA